MSTNGNGGGGAKRSKPTAGAGVNPATIGVVLAGFPHELAGETAKALASRGVSVLAGLTTATGETGGAGAGAAPLPLLPLKDAATKQKLEQVVQSAKAKNLTVVGVDVADSDEAHKLLEALNVPVVLNSRAGASRLPPNDVMSVSAVVGDEWNKTRAAFDAMWRDTAKRFPGLLGDDWRFEGLHVGANPFGRETKSLLDSFDNFFTSPQTATESAIKKVSDAREAEKHDAKVLEGHHTQQYTFKNGSGTSSFSFRTQFSGNAPAAEGIADSVLFLAEKTQQLARPQVYGLLDVLENGPVRMLGA